MIRVSLLLLAAAFAAETTIFNASVVSVDRARGTITVREAGAGGSPTRQLTVAPAAVAGLARLKAGSQVFLTLRGGAVVGIKTSAAAPQQRIPQLPPGASSPTSRGIPQLPAGANPPQGRPVPQAAPSGGVTVIAGSPSPGISPAAVVPRPAVSPVSVASPRSPGTPKPVVLPSDPPPTPLPSPLP